MRRVSEQSLANAAVFDLRRYSASRKRLEEVLLRKVKRVLREKGDKAGTLDEAKPLIAAVVERMVNAGYLDDQKLAEMKAASLHRQGKSARMIQLKLRQKGLSAALVAENSKSTPESELEAARTMAKKKKLGVHGPEATREERRRKELGVLVRAGFSFDVAKRALLAVVD